MGLRGTFISFISILLLAEFGIGVSAAQVPLPSGPYVPPAPINPQPYIYLVTTPAVLGAAAPGAAMLIACAATVAYMTSLAQCSPQWNQDRIADFKLDRVLGLASLLREIDLGREEFMQSPSALRARELVDRLQGLESAPWIIRTKYPEAHSWVHRELSSVSDPQERIRVMLNGLGAKELDRYLQILAEEEERSEFWKDTKRRVFPKESNVTEPLAPGFLWTSTSRESRTEALLKWRSGNAYGNSDVPSSFRDSDFVSQDSAPQGHPAPSFPPGPDKKKDEQDEPIQEVDVELIHNNNNAYMILLGIAESLERIIQSNPELASSLSEIKTEIFRTNGLLTWKFARLKKCSSENRVSERAKVMEEIKILLIGLRSSILTLDTDLRSQGVTSLSTRFDQATGVLDDLIDMWDESTGLQKTRYWKVIAEFIKNYPYRLRVNLDSEPNTTLVRPGKLRQVFLNLVKNSHESGASEVSIVTRLQGPKMHVWIIDNGSGIPAQKLNNLYDGVSTNGNGRGLGLQSSRRIVERLGGEMRVESEAGKGTTFELIFDY